MKQFRVLVRICIHSRAWTTSGTAWRGNEGPSWPAAQHIGAGSEACPSLLRNLALLVGFWFCSSHDGDGAVIRDAVVTRHPPLRQAPMTERAAVERCKWRNDASAGRSTEPITPSTSRCSSPRQMAGVNSAHGCCLSSLRCLRGPFLARSCQVMARRAAIGSETTATFRSAVATWFNKRTDRECLP